jgi:hypothetical protein
MYTCPKCNRDFTKSNSLNAHLSHCGKPQKDRFGKSRAWNKGLSKKTDIRVLRNAESLKENIKSGITKTGFQGKTHSSEYKEKMSIKQAKAYSGGLCKWKEYKKKDGTIIMVQGEWELRFAGYLDLMEKKWIKPGHGNLDYSFPWIDDEGIKRFYTPDFYLPEEDKYYEIKGYWREKDKIKMTKVVEQNTINIEIIEKKQMKNLQLL